jgi:hypothetical protein
VKLCLLCYSQGGVIVYEAGRDPTAAIELLKQAEREGKTCAIAILHPKPKEAR